MIRLIGEALLNGAKELGKYAVKQGPKILSAVISALIVIILEEITKFFLKRKLHKLYYNEGFKDGAQLADKVKEKLNEIIKANNLDDAEKLRRLKKYRTLINEIHNASKNFENEWDTIQKDDNITDLEKKQKLDIIQEKFHRKMKDLGII